MTDVEMRREIISGVLVEGHEYSGNNILARAIAHALQGNGSPVLWSHGCLTNDRPAQLLLGEVPSLFAGARPKAMTNPRCGAGSTLCDRPRE